MTALYELPNLGSRVQQAHAGRPERPERPSRRFAGLPGIGASRRVKGLESAFRRVVGGLSRWRRRRAAIRELQALSVHHLADIGLDRSQIASTVEDLLEARDR